jgi:hydrogenase expression/formation protein HypC
MCVAFPGKILKITNQHAEVDFAGTMATVNVSMVDAKVGDYVLVHAGMAIETMQEDAAKDLVDLFREVEEEAHAH